MLLAVFHLTNIEIGAKHHCALAVSRIVLPLSVVVVSICVVVLALSVLFAHLKPPLVSVSALKLHRSISMIFTISEFTSIRAILKLMVLTLSIDLSFFPMACIGVLVFILDVSLPVFEILFPFACIDTMRDSLFFFCSLASFCQVDLYIFIELFSFEDNFCAFFALLVAYNKWSLIDALDFYAFCRAFLFLP